MKQYEYLRWKLSCKNRDDAKKVLEKAKKLEKKTEGKWVKTFRGYKKIKE